jgi:hypothetical protein
VLAGVAAEPVDVVDTGLAGAPGDALVCGLAPAVATAVLALCGCLDGLVLDSLDSVGVCLSLPLFPPGSNAHGAILVLRRRSHQPEVETFGLRNLAVQE